MLLWCVISPFLWIDFISEKSEISYETLYHAFIPHFGVSFLSLIGLLLMFSAQPKLPYLVALAAIAAGLLLLVFPSLSTDGLIINLAILVFVTFINRRALRYNNGFSPDSAEKRGSG
jgi:hypothetical protein